MLIFSKKQGIIFVLHLSSLHPIVQLYGKYSYLHSIVKEKLVKLIKLIQYYKNSSSSKHFALKQLSFTRKSIAL